MRRNYIIDFEKMKMGRCEARRKTKEPGNIAPSEGVGIDPLEQPLLPSVQSSRL